MQLTKLLKEVKSGGDTGLFETLANALPAMVWIADTSKKCIWFNHGWLGFTGRTLEEEITKGWPEGKTLPKGRNKPAPVFRRF